MLINNLFDLVASISKSGYTYNPVIRPIVVIFDLQQSLSMAVLGPIPRSLK